MNMQRIENLYNWLDSIQKQPNWATIPYHTLTIINIKNEIIRISEDISNDYEHFSKELFRLKDYLFVGVGMINPVIYGEILAILRFLVQEESKTQVVFWNLIHPQIVKVSKKLYEDGYYSNAAEDAFIEINDRVKEIYARCNPSENVPDGDAAMRKVFSPNNPIITFEDIRTRSGQDIQKGFMEMAAGAISALRNPKAHKNITIDKDDAMRRLMFASMLMYKIDEAIKYSGISE